MPTQPHDSLASTQSVEEVGGTPVLRGLIGQGLSPEELTQASRQIASLCPAGALRAIRDGRTAPLESSFVAAQRYREGWTIQIEGIERYSWDFHRLSASVATQFGAQYARANVYMCRAGAAAALGFHSDPGRAIVLQLDGKKRWELESKPTGPESWVGPLASFDAGFGVPGAHQLRTVLLEAGGVLDVRGGTLHSANATAEHGSTHVTFALAQADARELTILAIEQLVTKSEDPALIHSGADVADEIDRLLARLEELCVDSRELYNLRRSLAAKGACLSGQRGHWLDSPKIELGSEVRWTGVSAQWVDEELVLSPGVAIHVPREYSRVVTELIEMGRWVLVRQTVSSPMLPGLLALLTELDRIGALEVRAGIRMNWPGPPTESTEVSKDYGEVRG